MKFKPLQTVVLDRNLPEHGLLKGDLGAIVEIYKPSDLEVEFVMADGTTGALVTLHESDVRPVASTDMGVRSDRSRGARLESRPLEVFGPQPRSLRDASEHPWPDLDLIVKRPHEVRPTRSLQDDVRTAATALDGPT
jgi:hypothetical protein